MPTTTPVPNPPIARLRMRLACAALLSFALSACGGEAGGPADAASQGADPLGADEAARESSEALAARQRAWDAPALAVRRSGAAWLACIAWDGSADALELRSVPGRTSHPPATLYRAPTRMLGLALAADERDALHAVWSEQTASGWELRTLVIAAPAAAATGSEASASAAEPELGTPGAVRTLLAESGARLLQPVLAADADGRLLLAWVRVHAGGLSIQAAVREPGGDWGAPLTVSAGGDSAWAPSLAAQDGGRFAVAWDAAVGGDYDVLLARLVAESGTLRVTAHQRVTDSPRFEAHAALAADGERLYLAYDVGPENWGREGSVNKLEVALHDRRHIEVVAIEGERFAPLAHSPVDGMPELIRENCEQPRLLVDGPGSLVLAWRGLPLPQSLDDPQNPEFQALAADKDGGVAWRTSIWFSYLSRLDGTGWSMGDRHQIRAPQSEGRCDAPIALAALSEEFFLCSVVGDGRTIKAIDPTQQPTREQIQERLYPWKPASQQATQISTGALRRTPPRGAIALGEFRALPGLRPGDRTPRAVPPSVRRPAGAEHGLRLALGDLHRHTDISRCASNWDGPISDALRYAFDSGPLDFLAVTDHFEHMTPYDWWRSMSLAEAYDVAGRMVSLRAYERVDGVTGHRNVISGDGAPPLVSYPGVHDPARDAGRARTPEALWAQLDGHRVLTIPHTPAGMFPGNPSVFDWTSFEPRYDRLVEVFQGYRGSSEAADAPRAIPGLKPEGYVRPNLDHGLHFGLIASSDHQSSHGAFAGAWVEDLSRGGVFDALQARRTFAATVRGALWCEWSGVPMGVSALCPAPDSGLSESFVVELDGFGRRAELIELFVDGALHSERSVSGVQLREEFPLAWPTSGSRYAYARVRLEGDEYFWSSPVRLSVGEWAGPDGPTGAEALPRGDARRR